MHLKITFIFDHVELYKHTSKCLLDTVRHIVDSNEFGTRPGRKYLMDPLVISHLPKTYECTTVLICLFSGLTPRLLFTLVFFMSPHFSVDPTSRIKFTNIYIEYKTVGYSSEMVLVEK